MVHAAQMKVAAEQRQVAAENVRTWLQHQVGGFHYYVRSQCKS